MKSVSRKGKVVTTLNNAEQMWLNLLETAVVFSREAASTVSERAVNTDNGQAGHTQIVDSLRVVVQDIFTSLLSLTSSTSSSHRRATTQISFLSILRMFLQNLSSSPLTDLRSVLSSIFDAYRYEKQLIQVTSKLVDADLFQEIITAKKERERGWRPTSANCMACNRILFGPGAKGSIFSKWEAQRQKSAETKAALLETRRRDSAVLIPGTPDGKGKGKSVELPPLPADVPTDPAVEDIEGDIVVFACGHAYHRECLAELRGRSEENREEVSTEEGEGEARFRCIVCEAH